MSEEVKNKAPMRGGPGGFGAGTKLKKGEFKKASKNISKSMKKYLPSLIVALILIVINVILQVLAPQYLKKLTDTLTAGSSSLNVDLNKINELSLILLVMYIVIALANYFSAFIMTTITQRYSSYLRTEITTKINKIPLKYFDSHSFGDILSRLTNDVDTIGTSLQQSLSMLVQSVLLLITVLIAMFVTSWQMALTALITLPLMMIFLCVILKFASPLFRRRSEKIGEVNNIVEENFSGQLIIKVFNAEKRVTDEFNKTNKELGKTMFNAQIMGGLMMPLMSLISYLAYAAVFIVGGLLLADGHQGVTYGTISAFTIYINLFQSPLSQIAQAMNTLQMAAASSTRVYDFLAQEEIVSDSNIKPVFLGLDGKEKVEGKVEFRHVKFSYLPDKEIIHDFSCVINPGMKVAIVGPTGAGKTTMVNLLERFYDVNSGEILIDNIDTKKMPRSEIRNIFGMVLQDTWVFNGTIRENLVYNSKNITEEQVQNVLKEVGLEHYVKSLPQGLETILSDNSSISNGQRQLITIARAMLKNAPLMILDEATSNVDTRTEEVIQDAMDKLTKGRTSFVIAHRLSTIKNSDLILVMKDGNIIEQGTHEELLTANGFYASLYNSQFAFE